MNKFTSRTRQFELELCWSSSKITSGFLTITSIRVSTSGFVFDGDGGGDAEATDKKLKILLK